MNIHSQTVPNTTKVAGVFLSVLLLGSNGCVSYCTIQKAEGHPERATWSQFVDRDQTPPPPNQPSKPAPVYYALLALTIPADIALYPIQALGWFADHP